MDFRNANFPVDESVNKVGRFDLPVRGDQWRNLVVEGQFFFQTETGEGHIFWRKLFTKPSGHPALSSAKKMTGP